MVPLQSADFWTVPVRRVVDSSVSPVLNPAQMPCIIVLKSNRHNHPFVRIYHMSLTPQLDRSPNLKFIT